MAFLSATRLPFEEVVKSSQKWQARLELVQSIVREAWALAEESGIHSRNSAFFTQFIRPLYRAQEAAIRENEEAFAAAIQMAEENCARYWDWRGHFKTKPKHWALWEDFHAATMVFFNEKLLAINARPERGRQG